MIRIQFWSMSSIFVLALLGCTITDGEDLSTPADNADGGTDSDTGGDVCNGDGCNGEGDVGDKNDIEEQPDPIDGLCGSHARDLYLEEQKWLEEGSFCQSGSLSIDAPTYPAPGETVSWSCDGEHGGSTATCTATRLEVCSADRQPPQGWTRLTTGDLSCKLTQQGWDPNSDCSEFDGIWPGSFMETSSLTRDLGIRSDDGRDYIAIRFTTEGLSSTDTGSWNFNISPWLQSRSKFVTISFCPGDFDREAIIDETGCYRGGVFTQNIMWGGTDTDRDCKLEADREYYFNFLYTSDDSGTPAAEIEPHPDCVPPTRCGNLLAP